METDSCHAYYRDIPEVPHRGHTQRLNLRGSSASRSKPSEADAIEQKEKELQLCGQKIDTLNSKLNILEEQLEKCNKEISSLGEKNEALARKNWRMNEDKALIAKNHEQQLEKCNKEISSLKAKNETLARKINEDTALKVKILEQQLEKCNNEISSLKGKNEAKWKKREKAIASVMVGNVELRPKTSNELLVLYYTKRADTRMSSKKFRKAIDDCKMATDLDPRCLKALLINGSCHLALGEIDEAQRCYNKLLSYDIAQSDGGFSRKAYEGLQDVEIVASNIKLSTELLQLKTFESATTAKKTVIKALSVSCHSEKLLKLKGEALFQLHEYKEVIQMCDQTVVIAKKNCDNIKDSKCLSEEDLWRWSLMSRSYYRMGKFDISLIMFEKYEHIALSETKSKELSLFSAVIVRELLQIKTAGNDALQSGNHIEAAKHYTDAIMRSIESRPFTAIFLCNRAAAHQHLGNYIDAIKDCNLAIALDGDYMKAISRRAGLYEMIRDYEHASLDMERLISLQEKRSEKKYVKDLKDTRERLSSVKKNMGKGMSMDLYMILGLKGSESGSEIKKAYDKAARSPDEASKFLAISESGTDGHIWKEIKKTIRTDANKLFKKIGEAYDVLSDSNKRKAYN